MKIRALLAAAIFLGALSAAGPAAGEWRNSVRQEFVAEENRKHPRRGGLVLRLPVDAPHGADLCFAYSHWRQDQAGRGAVQVTARVTRQNGPSGPLELIAEASFGKVQVSDSTAGDCRHVGLLEAGDVATFRFKFIRLPRLRVSLDNELEATFQYSASVNSRE